MDKTNTNQVLEKILNSPTFANKEVLKGLLGYLFESSKKGTPLKEIDIALDFFKRKNEFLPGDDTIVRVNIHKLRSLLEKYYLNEGKKDDTIIEIPKGSYALNFTGKKQRKSIKLQGHKIKIIVFVLLALSVCFNLAFLIRASLISNKNNPVWAGYIKSGQPVYITLCDPFFFRVKDTATNTIIVRDITINSPDELKRNNSYIIPEKGTKISELTYPYFSTSNVWPLPDIISIFAKENIETRLQALSESKAEDIKRNNEIFIANINSFGFINKFLEQTSIRLHTNPRQIIIIKKGADTVFLSVPEYIHGYYIDYAFLVKIPGPNENLITIMGDFHASGIKGLSRYITKQSSLNKLSKKVKKDFGKFPDFFEMVVKVTSYNYSDFTTELIYFNPLKGNIAY